MDSKSLVKILGTVATIVGLGATLLSDWVKDKTLDEKIEDKVNNALARRREEESV